MKKVFTLFTVAAMALVVFSSQKADLSLSSEEVP